MKFDTYKSTPVGSLIIKSETEGESYLQMLSGMPVGLRTMLMSNKTGAFIRGLVKSYDIAPEKTPELAFTVLRIGVGEHPLNQLSSLLIQKLGLSSTQAESSARDIEKDLFTPIMLEYNTYIAKQKSGAKTAPTTAHATGARNVLDLKTQRPVPPPPPIPPRQP